MSNMFEEMADEIFAAAHIVKKPDSPGQEDGNMWLHAQCANILANKMAMVSHLGLTQERVDLFNEQKEALIQDLVNDHGGYR